MRDEDDDDDTGRRKTEECERSDERKDSQRQGEERKVTSHAQAQAYTTTQERARQCEPKQKDDGRHGGQGLVEEDSPQSRLS